MHNFWAVTDPRMHELRSVAEKAGKCPRQGIHALKGQMRTLRRRNLGVSIRQISVSTSGDELSAVSQIFRRSPCVVTLAMNPQSVVVELGIQ